MNFANAMQVSGTYVRFVKEKPRVLKVARFDSCSSKSFNSILIRENKGQREPGFLHILRSTTVKGNKEIETIPIYTTVMPVNL